MSPDGRTWLQLSPERSENRSLASSSIMLPNSVVGKGRERKYKSDLLEGIGWDECAPNLLRHLQEGWPLNRQRPRINERAFPARQVSRG
jgi:hypothetical protein